MRVRCNPDDHSIEVEGVDITPSVRRWTVDCDKASQAKVYIELMPGQDLPSVLETDMVVHITTDAVEVDTPSIIVAWLGTLDPGSIERELLDGANLAEGMGLAIVRVLAKMAAQHG